jgi:lysozyme family protein
VLGNFHRCSLYIKGYEGGFVNHPRDPGGPTNLGICLHTWAAHLHVPDSEVSIADMKALTWDQVEPLYQSQYWASVAADRLPAGLDLVVFNRSVMSGPVHAVKILQAALGVRQDGHVGAGTIAAAVKADVRAVVRTYARLALAFERKLSTWSAFGDGWTSREEHVTAAALAMVGKPVLSIAASPAVVAALHPAPAPFTPAEVRGKADPRSLVIARTPVGKAQGLTIAGAATAVVAQAGDASGVLSALGDKLAALPAMGEHVGHVIATTASGCAAAGAALAVVALFRRSKDHEELSA